jgi:hypothetical protein
MSKAEMFIKNALDNGEGFWSIYQMIRDSYMPEWEKIECYKVLKEKMESEGIYTELWKKLKSKVEKMKKRNIHKREFII